MDVIDLDSARAALPAVARDLLDAVWDAYRVAGFGYHAWPATQSLHIQRGKSAVGAALAQLPRGSIYTTTGTPARYALSALGVLLTSQGPGFERMLARYLEYVIVRARANPHLTEIVGADAAEALGLSRDQRILLGHLVGLSGLWSGAHSGGAAWTCGVPPNLDDLIEVEDVRSYIWRRATSDAWAMARPDPRSSPAGGRRFDAANNDPKVAGAMGTQPWRRIERIVAVVASMTGLIVVAASIMKWLPPTFGALTDHPVLALAVVAIGAFAVATYLLRGSQQFAAKVRQLIALAIIVACGAVIGLVAAWRSGHSSFHERFDHADLQSLTHNGWVRMNPDDSLWTLGSTSGCLTLYTGRGDNWTTESEAGLCPIRNMMAQHAPSGDFEAIARISRFAPRANWQQAGVIILGHGNRYTRFTYSFDSSCSPPTKFQAVTSRGDNTPRGHPEGEFNGRPFSVPWNDEELWLRVERRGNTFSFCHKTVSYYSWRPDTTMVLEMRPEWVALAAFEGCSEHPKPNINLPITAKPEPVDFDDFYLTAEAAPFALPPWAVGALVDAIALLIAGLLERLLPGSRGAP